MTADIPPDQTATRYFVSLGPQTIVVHLLGRPSYLNCRAMGRFLEIQARKNPGRRLFFNLTECVTLDSTVAGLIAKSAFDAASGHEWGRVGIIRAQPRVRAVLTNLGLGHIADFLEETPPGAGMRFEDLSRFADAVGTCSPEEIVTAHEALIALDESNVERFGDVILALRNDPDGLQPVVEPPPETAKDPLKPGRIKFTPPPWGA